MLEPDWRRRAARVAWDCYSWLIATMLIVAARYDFHLNPAQYRALAIYVVVACLLQGSNQRGSTPGAVVVMEGPHCLVTLRAVDEGR